MKIQLTRVRKSNFDRSKWVVSILVNPKYVQPDGTAGGFHEYDTKMAAEAAEAIFLRLNSSTVKRELVLHNSKQTNPKDLLGVLKTPISTLSCQVLYEMGLGMLEGARKYGRHNYRTMGVSATVYYDAAIGHLMDWWEGEDIDPDSGLSHITKAMTALVTLRDSMLMGNWTDDRPIRNSNKLYKKHFNVKAKEIIEKYPDSKAPYLETDSEDRKCGKTI